MLYYNVNKIQSRVKPSRTLRKRYLFFPTSCIIYVSTDFVLVRSTKQLHIRGNETHRMEVIPTIIVLLFTVLIYFFKYWRYQSGAVGTRLSYSSRQILSWLSGWSNCHVGSCYNSQQDVTSSTTRETRTPNQRKEKAITVNSKISQQTHDIHCQATSVVTVRNVDDISVKL